MTAETQIIPTQQRSPSHAFTLSPEASALSVELAKCLKLVAPASMMADAQLSWIASAIDALEGIRAAEVAAISAEIRRSVTRPAQIVPEIARLVSEKRQRSVRVQGDTPFSREAAIDREASERRARATTRAEIEGAWQWERHERMAAKLPVKPLAAPLTRDELDGLPDHLIALGRKAGLLERKAGQLVESQPYLGAPRCLCRDKRGG